MTTSADIVADGATSIFSVPCPYLDRSHIKVELDGIAQATSTYTWLTSSTLQFNSVPPHGTVIRISRRTPRAPLTEYQRGATLTKSDLETDSKQALYLIEEILEGTAGGGAAASSAAAVAISDTLGNFNSSQVEGALAELASRIAPPIAANVPIADPGNVFPADNVQAAIEYLLANGGAGAATADAVAIADVGNKFTATTVEGALQEIAADSASGLRTDLTTTGSDKGADLVRFRNTFTGGATRRLTQKLMERTSLTDFGAVLDNATDAKAAFDAAEACAEKRIYIPVGTVYTTNALNDLKKRYYGEGKIRFSTGDVIPASFTFVKTRPATGTGTDYVKYATADLSTCEMDTFIVGDIRTGLDEPYFESATNRRLEWFDNRAGYSGWTCSSTAAVSAGATSIAVNSSDGLVVGTEVGFVTAAGTIGDRRVLTAVTATSLSWATGLSNAYPVGTRVTKGMRTMHSYRHAELKHRGGGDCYINMFRVEASYARTAGQTHTYAASTAGIDGGDMVAGANHVYMTVREVTMDDAGYDIDAVSDVRSFLRHNDTGFSGASWLGCMFLSSGTKAADAGYVIAGKWKCGLDTTRADLSTGAQTAIRMSEGQLINFDSNGSTDPNLLYERWGRVAGTTTIGYDTTYQALRVMVKGQEVARFNNTFGTFFAKDVNLDPTSFPKLRFDGGSGDTYIHYALESGSDRIKVNVGGAERFRYGPTRTTSFVPLEVQGQGGIGLVFNDVQGFSGAMLNGGANATPANPATYMLWQVQGVNYAIPLYRTS